MSTPSIGTTTTLTASPTTARAGTTVELRAQVSATSGTPIGSVTFFDGATSLGSASLGAGTATFGLSTLRGGDHDLTAHYDGAGSHGSSTSAAVTVHIVKNTATVTLESAPTSGFTDTDFVFTARVASDGTPAPTGTVVFELDDGTLLGTGPVLNGTASISARLPAWWHAVSATYGGDPFTGGGDATQYVSVSDGDAPQLVDDTIATHGQVAYVSMFGNDRLGGASGTGVTSTPAAHGSASCTTYSYTSSYPYWYVSTYGVCTYAPVAGYVGTDSFTYSIPGAGAPATITVNVTANRSPTAVADVATVHGTDAVQVVANDRDVDGDWITIASATNPAHGTVSCNSWACSYTPTAGYLGSDSFTYTISDSFGATDTATVSVTVDNNTPPVATDDGFDVRGTRTVYLDSALGNDSDPDGNPVSITSVATPAHGSVSCWNPSWGGCYWTYQAASGFSGVDSFDYTISDGHGGTDTGTITVRVAANASPVASPDSASIRANTNSTTIPGVTGNDTDADGDPLYVVSCVAVSGTASPYWGGCSYVPQPGTTSDTITYVVSDNYGGTASSTINLTITPNHTPVAVVDTVAAVGGIDAWISLLANDTDPDGDPLSVTATTTPAHGTLYNDGRSVAYLAERGFVGSDSFGYTVSDDHGGTATSNVTVNVTADSPPTAVDDTLTAHGISGVWAWVVGNDVDPDPGDRLSIAEWDQPAHGTAQCDWGACSYVPAAGFSGSDSFSYTIRDVADHRSTATVAVTVAANLAPLARSDRATVAVDGVVTLDPLANDSDPDGSYVWIKSVSQPAHGFATCSTWRCRYVPESGFVGTDKFAYVISDGDGATATANVTMTVATTSAMFAAASTATAAAAGTAAPFVASTRAPAWPVTRVHREVRAARRR